MEDLPANIRAYRAARLEAGHPGRGEAYLQVPIYVAGTRERAEAKARDGMMRFATYRADLLRGPLMYEVVLQQEGIVGTPDMVVGRIAELRDTAGLDGISAEEPISVDALT